MAGVADKINDLFSRVVNSLITISVSALVGGIGAALVFLWRNAVLSLAIGIGLAVFGVILVAGWVIMVIYRKKKLMYVSYPSPGFHAEVVKKTISYSIDENGALTFKREVELKALVDNVANYTDRFLWTGNAASFPRPGRNVSEVRENKRAGIWTYYDAVLDKVLRRGEKLSISVAWPKIDRAYESRPFVSTSTEEPTDTVIFDVSIPSKYRKNDKLVLEEMRSIESITPFKTTDGEFHEDRYRIEIAARPYAHYRISWKWSDNLPTHGADL
ncbi:hypothetical protein FK535_17540 [Mycolicibacterium sp. 018/SC-01/001]|uniref:hypothetical protein n=1 Tax=Mycolicibacterium sp. 018/SC-01/001 TaxID=2592069 RepID=UPI001180E076|nr:hypothetical protein [Mycolicibacterium sp. 018/SC-01/001]TRW81257.1 hypothetical protein FK535_17540 [Mycolicibacterium sp. 018/SC-01/001]